MAPILGPDSQPLAARGWHDAKSIADDGGTLHVGIEGVNQIVQFDYGKSGVLVVGTRLAVPPAATVASALSPRFLSSDPRVKAAARGPVDGSRDDLCYLTAVDAPAGR